MVPVMFHDARQTVQLWSLNLDINWISNLWLFGASLKLEWNEKQWINKKTQYTKCLKCMSNYNNVFIRSVWIEKKKLTYHTYTLNNNTYKCTHLLCTPYELNVEHDCLHCIFTVRVCVWVWYYDVCAMHCACTLKPTKTHHIQCVHSWMSAFV